MVMFGLWPIFVFVILILAGVFRLGLAWRGDGARHLRRCRRCNYVVDATELLTCPECGHEHVRDEDMRFSARSRAAIAVAAAMCVIGTLGLVVPVMRSAGVVAALPEPLLIRVWSIARHVAPTTAAHCENEFRSRTFDRDEMESLALGLLEVWNDSRTSNDDRIAEFLSALTVRDGDITASGETMLDAAGGELTDESAHYFANAPESLVDPLELAARRQRGRDDSTPATLLAIMSRTSPRACQALVRLCASDPHFRMIALGRAGEVMVSTLASIVRDEQAPLSERIAAADLLSALDALEPDFAPEILALLKRAPQEHRAMLASFIASWTSDDERVRALHGELISLVRNDASPRAEIIFALADIIPDIDPSVLSSFEVDLASTSAATRARACALFALNESDREIEPFVESVCTGPERIVLYDALQIARRRSESLERAALADVSASDPRLADAATRYLKSIDDVADRQSLWNQLLSHPDPAMREFGCERFIEDSEADPDESMLQACARDRDEWVALAARRALARRLGGLERSLDASDEINARFRRLERRGEDASALVNELLLARDDRVRELTIQRMRLDAKNLRIDPVTVRQLGSKHLSSLVTRMVREDDGRLAAGLIIDAVSGIGADIAALRIALSDLSQDEREGLKVLIARTRAAMGETAKQSLQELFSDQTNP